MSEPTTTEPTEPQNAPTGDEPTAQPAVTDWEAEAKKWEKRSKDNFAKLKDAEPKLAEYDRMVEANKTAEQRQAEELTRWQSDAEKWRRAAVGSRVETIASADFADPSDALGALGDDLTRFLGVDGQINNEAIRTELASVLERKPHWRRSDATPAPRTPAPNPAQGTGGNSAADPATAFASIVQSQLSRGG